MTRLAGTRLTGTRLTGAGLARWAVPGALTAAVVLVASGVFSADATPPLPRKTAAELLVDVQQARVEGLSGTVVQNADLGLPALPNLGSRSGTSLTSLLTGSHTLRVWYAGETKQRVAVLGSLGESDVVRNGADLWTWSSETNTATHARLPAAAQHERGVPPAVDPTPLTPAQAADRALRAIEPTTQVSTDGTRSVAGRAAYELVLRPRDARSLVGQVRIAVDGETHVPLRVQVYPATSADGPAFEVGFTRVSFARPGDAQFRFTPPPGATVTESRLSPAAHERSRPGATTVPRGGAAAGSDGPLRTVGTGWTTVAVISGVQLPSGGAGPSGPAGERSGGGAQGSAAGQLAALLDRLPPVSGPWGSGRLLTSKVLSALLTDDGRLIVGAVSPQLLYAAAGQR